MYSQATCQAGLLSAFFSPLRATVLQAAPITSGLHGVAVSSGAHSMIRQKAQHKQATPEDSVSNTIVLPESRPGTKQFGYRGVVCLMKGSQVGGWDWGVSGLR